jgi:hypothetical protein
LLATVLLLLDLPAAAIAFDAAVRFCVSLVR